MQRISTSRNTYIAAIHTMMGQLTEATVNGWTDIPVSRLVYSSPRLTGLTRRFQPHLCTKQQAYQRSLEFLHRLLKHDLVRVIADHHPARTLLQILRPFLNTQRNHHLIRCKGPRNEIRLQLINAACRSLGWQLTLNRSKVDVDRNPSDSIATPSSHVLRSATLGSTSSMTWGLPPPLSLVGSRPNPALAILHPPRPPLLPFESTLEHSPAATSGTYAQRPMVTCSHASTPFASAPWQTAESPVKALASSDAVLTDSTNSALSGAASTQLARGTPLSTSSQPSAPSTTQESSDRQEASSSMLYLALSHTGMEQTSPVDLASARTSRPKSALCSVSEATMQLGLGDSFEETEVDNELPFLAALHSGL